VGVGNDAARRPGALERRQSAAGQFRETRLEGVCGMGYNRRGAIGTGATGATGATGSNGPTGGGTDGRTASAACL